MAAKVNRKFRGNARRRRHGEQFFTPNLLFAPRSHRRRYSIPTDPPRAALQRSIGLLDPGDENFRTRLEIALVPRHISHSARSAQWMKDMFEDLRALSHARVRTVRLFKI